MDGSLEAFCSRAYRRRWPELTNRLYRLVEKAHQSWIGLVYTPLQGSSIYDSKKKAAQSTICSPNEFSSNRVPTSKLIKTLFFYPLCSYSFWSSISDICAQFYRVELKLCITKLVSKLSAPASDWLPACKKIKIRDYVENQDPIHRENASLHIILFIS
jgi:hypothetical protein